MSDKIWKFYETHAWTQGALKRIVRTGMRLTIFEATSMIDKSEPIAYCMIGAAREVYQDIHMRTDICDMIQKKLGRGIARWNDEDGRTKADVIALCKELDV